MNSFGRIIRVSIYGESHGAGVGVVLDGVPAGIPIDLGEFEKDMLRRKGGQQKGTTPRQEEDVPNLLSGYFNGHTTGAPINIFFPNQNTRSADYDKTRSFPRPSHADFVAHHKYAGFEDYRGGGHFSARLTTGIVAAGVIAKKILAKWSDNKIDISAQVTAIAGQADIEIGLEKLIKAKDSGGALIACTVTGLPVGIGEPFWDSVESVLAHALFSIPAVKGVSFGAGFKAAEMLGKAHNDAIVDMEGTTTTNHAGGIVGGITNGNALYFELAIKPTASTPQPQESLNWDSGQVESFQIKGRHDLCVGLRAPVIVEAMTALVLCDLWAVQRGINKQ